MKNNIIAFSLKFSVSAGLIWYLLKNTDIQSAKERLMQVKPEIILLVLIILSLQVLINAARWKSVLVAIKSTLSFYKTIQITAIGIFFNQFLPSSAGGDAVRVYKAYRSGLSLGSAINSVMLERIATVLALILVVLFMLPNFLPRVEIMSSQWFIPSIILATTATIVGIIILLALERLPESLRHWRLIRGLSNLGSDTRNVFFSLRSASQSLWWSALGHVNITLCLYILAGSLKLDVTFLDCLALFPAILLLTAIPISIAGWGVREGAMVAAFGLIGVPEDGAFVLSVLFGLTSIVFGIICGGVWLMSSDRHDDIVGAASLPGRQS